MTDTAARSLPALLLERAATTPHGVAVRRFTLGAWRETTWAQLRDEAAAVGTGLASLGITAGDDVAVVTDNGSEWFAIEMGAQGIGATVLGFDDDLSPVTGASLLRAARAKAVIVGDQEQYDKVAEMRHDLTDLELVAVIDTRGMRHLDKPDRPDGATVLSLAQLRSRGAVASGWEAQARSVGGHDGAVIATTVRNAKVHAEMLTHDQALTHGRALADALALGPHDILSTLHTFAGGAEHAFGVVAPLLRAVPVHFGEAGLLEQGLRQVQPTLVFTRPSWLASISDDAQRRVVGTGGIKAVALRRGLIRRPPATKARTAPFPNINRTVGLAAAALVLALFLAWPNGDDVVRLILALAIILATVMALVLSGRSAAGPARRRLGLSRCRAVVMADEAGSSGADLLGALAVPLVIVPLPAGTPVSLAASESLT